jgi:hypothetical protein
MSPQLQGQEREQDELQAGTQLTFAVFPKPSVLLAPIKGPFHHPAFGNGGKGR